MFGYGYLAVANRLSAYFIAEVMSVIGGFCVGPLLAIGRQRETVAGQPMAPPLLNRKPGKDPCSYPSDPTTRRHAGAKFGPVSGAFDRIENGYTQLIDPYRNSCRQIRCTPKSSDAGSECSSGNFGQQKRPYKSCTCRPSETVWAVLRVRCSTS